MNSNNQKIKTILIHSMLTAVVLGLTACGNSNEKSQEKASHLNDVQKTTENDLDSSALANATNEKTVESTIKTPVETTMAVNNAETIAIEALAMADEVDTQ